MEYCSGHGLLDFMNQHLRDLLSETQILQIAFDIGAGLAYMHYLDTPLIHRDLKIENVLISGDGVFKLCDFGSASPVLRPPRNAQEFQILEHDIQNRTTMQYRSPEMVDLTRGFPIDEKSDIWAFGVFVYKLCYYTTPFEKGGDPAILKAKYTFPSIPAFSDRLKRLISVCLNEDPRNRPNVYQVLKEICDMRGTKVPLSDIYASPTSTQRIVQIPSPAPPSAALPIPSSSAGGFLDPSTPASRSAVNVPLSTSNHNLPLPPDQQQPTAVSGSIQIPPANNQAYTQVPSSSSSTNLPTDPFFTVPSVTGKSHEERQMDYETAENAASKFPTIEEITLSLENQGLNQSQPRSGPASYSKSSSRVNLNSGAVTQPYPDSSLISSPPSSFSAASPWGVSTATSAAVTNPMNPPITYPSSSSTADFMYMQQGMPSIQPTKSIPQAPYSQHQYRPQMVSHSTMTSPSLSRTHTPAPNATSRASPVLNSQTVNDDSVDIGVGTDDLSSSSDDEPVVDGTRSVASIKAEYDYSKPQLFSRPSDSGSNVKPVTAAYSGHINEQQQTISTRSSEERQRPRPVSMFVQNKPSESLIDASDDFQPSHSMKRTASRSNPQLKPTPSQDEVILIEPVVSDEKDKLKSLLTGLNEKSSTVVLDDGDEYINNSVDFLKALNRETVGRPRHSRSPSGSSLRDEPTNLYPVTSASNRKSITHSKKSSVSLKHAVSSKLGDAFKKFDSNRAPSFSRNESSRQAQLADLKKNKFSYSSDNLNTYESDPEEVDYPSKFDRFQSSKGIKRHQSTRVASNTGRSGSNVQSRIQAFMGTRNEAPPPKTASGYGKYTDDLSEDNTNEDSNDEVENNSSNYPSHSYTATNSSKNNNERLSADVPNESSSQGRKSFESALRNSEKIKKMVSNPITVSLSGDKDSKSTQNSDSLAPGTSESSKSSSFKKHYFLRHHRDRKSVDKKSSRYRDGVDSESSSDEGYKYSQQNTGGLKSENTIVSSRQPQEAPMSSQLNSQHDFHFHKRQLSTISSASSSTEDSSMQHTGSRKPAKPSKPAHLQSPRHQSGGNETDQERSGGTEVLPNPPESGPGKYNSGTSKLVDSRIPASPGNASALKQHANMRPTDTGTTDNSNLIEMSPAQSPVATSYDDWKEVFDNKYPSIV